MSGPNPPDHEGDDLPGQGSSPGGPESSETDAYSQAYSAPESEQFTSGPYVPADSGLYDYDTFEPSDRLDPAEPPRWPWVVGVVAIVAAIALVVSVSVLVTRTDTDNLSQPETSTTTPPPPPVQDEITTTTPPPPPPETAPPPPPTTRAGPRQVTYSVTGTKAPGDIITVTYIDASGRSRTQRNVYIPWSLTVTPISQSEVGSVQASSLFLVSRLNCSITTSDGTVLSSNTNNSAQTAC
ncbi:MmpS family transport accessory protein [Mycolicibacterium tusciae]|uniref:Transport accessory protein MmpS3 n=1 Tax=Mycolicibacterium tusciae TaxID=75922 RepID=A0A1X0JUJ4_9MYCO|nr:MmpS family transport accessory protein [Mycolicibacterium tusciae]ORB66275.1 hypothetical protein BST47_10465 [Mycolicibacterium tusciae]